MKYIAIMQNEAYKMIEPCVYKFNSDIVFTICVSPILNGVNKIVQNLFAACLIETDHTQPR